MPLGKGMNPFIPTPSYGGGQIVSMLFFYKDGFGIKITHKGWYAIKQRNQFSLLPK